MQSAAMQQSFNGSDDGEAVTSTMATEEETSGINALPDEILEFVLTYLPPYRDLHWCSAVSKRWHVVVKNLIRRSKLNMHKGLLDYRLRWDVVGGAPVSVDAAPAVPAPCSTIAGRFSHSAVRCNNSMYIFGGGSSSDTTFNDLWRFDLSAMCWERPLSMGSYPSPKGSASMVHWREQLVLFGGWRYPSLHPPYQPWCLFDELHYYDLASNRWTVRANALPGPPPMAGHSASVHGDRMVIFGGYQIADGVNSNSNETWCLNLLEQKWWQPRFAGGNAKPPPRYGQFQLELDEAHLLIMGGCGGPNSVYADAWLLDMSRCDAWTWRAIPVRNKKFGASHMWCNPACKLDSKLVVLGPTPNMPQDFQMMKQSHVPGGGGGGLPRLPPGAGPANQRNNNLFERPRPGPPLGAAAAGGRLPGGAGPVRVPAHNNQERPGNNRLAGGGGGQRGLHAPPGGPDDQYYANRRAILNQHQQNANNNFLNNNNHAHHGASNGNGNGNGNNNNNANLQPRYGRLRDLHAASSSAASSSSSAGLVNGVAAAIASTSAAATARRNDNDDSQNAAAANGNAAGCSSGSSSNNSNDIEAANRLQRNLALRCRENEPLLPKRFDELYEDPFRMAAFNVQSRSPRSVSKDHSERIRRMEEKMNAIRNSRRNAAAMNNNEPKVMKEPSPKRIKRNVLSLFVCDLSGALDANEPHVEWVEYKNYGILPGAPERLILSTMVAGHGELILFGGVHKETLSEITHQVSNTVHLLSAPRDIV